MSFTKKVLISMLAGIIVGVLINNFLLPNDFVEYYLINQIFLTISSLFLILLKMIVLPLIFVSVISGIVSINDVSTLGRLGAKTFSLYILTTLVAITLALFISSFVNYDTVGQITNNIQSNIEENIDQKNIILSIFPTNFFSALANGNVIQVLAFAVFVGVAASYVKKEIPIFIELIDNMNKVFNKMVMIIIQLTPIAVFALLAKTFATEGVEVFIPLIKYFLVVVFVLITHFILTYSILLRLFSNLSIYSFYTKLKALIIFTFSTSSSNASIPYTLNTVVQKYGVDKSFASFSIPLGATINMDGTAIMQGCAAYFLASYYGINLAFSDMITIILTATIASVGTAGIPSAGIIMLSLILTELGIPLEGITLLLGVDRLLDMMRTSVNVTGDTCITCVVAKSEGLINIKNFNQLDR
ncbi:MAG: dicarboxylate/amino acid:cation symporter [Gammaproteobacteria bacterium]|nr:dicarboxylate/amino acid:cation symporter [Gammaproteobacteria bacterium]MBT7236393.1 dicarboxylate/amino acid:cation symporter [Gammaproteobacteria bacterium]